MLSELTQTRSPACMRSGTHLPFLFPWSLFSDVFSAGATGECVTGWGDYRVCTSRAGNWSYSSGGPPDNRAVPCQDKTCPTDTVGEASCHPKGSYEIAATVPLRASTNPHSVWQQESSGGRIAPLVNFCGVYYLKLLPCHLVLLLFCFWNFPISLKCLFLFYKIRLGVNFPHRLWIELWSFESHCSWVLEFQVLDLLLHLPSKSSRSSHPSPFLYWQWHCRVES